MYYISSIKSAFHFFSKLSWLLVVLAPQFCFSSVKKVLTLNQETHWVNPEWCYTIEDSKNIFTIKDFVNSSKDSLFITQDNELGYNQHRESTYWKKIVIRNQSSAKSWMIELPDPHIENVEVSIVKNGHVETFSNIGFSHPFHHKQIKHKNFVFEFNFADAEEVIIYFKIKSSVYCGITPIVRNIKNFAQYFFSEYYYLGIYYGVILILMIYNLIMGFFLKEKIHFYYCFYVLSCSFFTFSEDGVGFQFLWGNMPELNAVIRFLAPVLLLFSFLTYTENFLALKKSSFHIYTFVVSSALLYLYLHIFDDLFSHTQHLFYIVPFALTFYAGIKLYQNNFKPARFFIVSNSLILISFVVYFLRVKGWVISNIYTVYLFNFGFVFESIVLSISVADKVKNTKEKAASAQLEVIRQLKLNDELQQKVNIELETKVSQRTKQLSEKTHALTLANEALETLKKELYEMNSKMDLNIYQLKKEVVKEKEARILHAEVSYEEFKNIFTEDKCIQYLENQKWKNGFVCLKCKNTKASRGNNKHTLKCSSCSHQESITAHTLFHGVRFPLTKAFYLVYFFMQKGKTKSYEELSEHLDINKNTVWKFYKKIETALSENPKLVNEWKEILLKAPK